MTSSVATDARELLDELIDVAERDRREHGVPGCAVGVAAGGAVRANGLGVSSLETGRPVTTGTLFRLCSLSKPFTATLVMSLVEEGLLDLDSPVTAYVPELPLADRRARQALTLRHLLSHTTGFECELPGDLERFGSDDGALQRAVAEFGSLRQWLPPGTAYGYCNAGYWLAGAIAARATQGSFEWALRERVLEPLGMRRTCFTADEAILHPVALPYRARTDETTDPEPVDTFRFPRARIPSGGLISSIDDLLRFVALHLRTVDGPVLSAAGRARQREHIVPSGPPGRWQGLGWSITERGATDVVGHDGSYGGYHATLLLIPSRGLAAAVLTNGADGWQITEAVGREFLELVLGPAEPESAPVSLPDTVLAALSGPYADPGEPGSVVTVEISSGGLALKWPRGKERDPHSVRYVPISPTEFVEADRSPSGDRIEFLLDGGEVPIAVRIDERVGGRLRSAFTSP